MAFHKKETECSICLSNFIENKHKVTLGCSHIFHYSCLLRWSLQPEIQTNYHSCPVCRDSIGTKEIIDTLSEHYIYQRDSWGAPHINNNTGRMDLSTISEITSIDQGLEVICKDCHHSLQNCSVCSFKTCHCEYTFNDHRWITRQFYCPSNPFSNISVIQTDNGIPHSCARCFENRDGIILEFIMNTHTDHDIFEEPRIIDLFNIFYIDSSSNNREMFDELYDRYPTYEYDDFKEYIIDIFVGEVATIH